MLVVLHMVRGLDSAQRIENLLQTEGLFVRIHPIYKGVSAAENYYEIKVLASEMQEAREFLMENRMM